MAITFTQSTASVFVPFGGTAEAALEKTTVLAIGAHHDDIEIMAHHGILRAFGSDQESLTGVVVTNGSGSPRDDLYAAYTDEQMMAVRRREQCKAAVVGDYGAAVFLDHSSAAVKDQQNPDPVADLKALLTNTRPDAIYTHNLTDKHDTHVGVVLRLLQALQELPAALHPKQFYGCEVWRALDWLCDDDKCALDVSAHENLAMALVGVFDSQICGGKRYDLATQGRRRANATYLASHATDDSQALTYAMDLMPLLQDPTLDPGRFAESLIDNFAQDVKARIGKLQNCGDKHDNRRTT